MKHGMSTSIKNFDSKRLHYIQLKKDLEEKLIEVRILRKKIMDLEKSNGLKPKN